ncbi:uncharacterized protein EI90DRAFT_3019101 [Cantharellus anzutake]|uniref:uncharacterized protein n=1 Tax=Cantharellus anzutake TaxID=1750568 RepID=UPI001906F168|nr:uncharacterized protein EI90DRAFT_3019101 [Cantharellus anzutake]KAF8325302.1 hypothetical protein EI90DRAFT_3019101 [Cantharellus anzutake]
MDSFLSAHTIALALVLVLTLVLALVLILFLVPSLHAAPTPTAVQQGIHRSSNSLIPTHKWYKIEISTQCWVATLLHHLEPASLAAQYWLHSVWGIKANILRPSFRKDLQGNSTTHVWRHMFLLKESILMDSFKQFIFATGHFFDDHTSSIPLLDVKGIAAFASIDDLVCTSCAFKHAVDKYELALLHQLAPPPLRHEVIPDVLLDYWSYPPIAASPHQLYYSAAIDRNTFGSINFVAEIWLVESGEMNALIQCIATW